VRLPPAAHGIATSGPQDCHWRPIGCAAKEQNTEPFGEASNNGAAGASTFGGVSTSDSDECRAYALAVAVTSDGETTDAAAAAASVAGAGGNLVSK